MIEEHNRISPTPRQLSLQPCLTVKDTTPLHVIDQRQIYRKRITLHREQHPDLQRRAQRINHSQAMNTLDIQTLLLHVAKSSRKMIPSEY